MSDGVEHELRVRICRIDFIGDFAARPAEPLWHDHHAMDNDSADRLLQYPVNGIFAMLGRYAACGGVTRHEMAH